MKVLFEILSGDIPSIILFAGIRFFISGLVLIMISSIKQKKFDKPQKSDMKHILLGALFTIILHYSLTYIALSLGEGSKSAIIKQIGFLFLSCFAFVFDKEDKWSVRKMLAGILGFLGIIATNSDSTGFTFKIADLLLILSSFCSVFGSVVAKRSSKTMPSVIKNCGFVSSEGLTHRGDKIHFNSASYRIFGKRYFEMFLNLYEMKGE